MHVAIVADPQVDGLLAPAYDTIQLALQIEHQAIDKMQVVARDSRVLDPQQVSLQLIARRVQRILQFAQRPGGFRKQQLAAGDRRSPVLCSAAGDVVLHQLLLFIHDPLGQIDAVKISATEYFSGAKTLRCQ
nr:Uncharacterised protein [Raoultella sp. NCTC 9187]